MGEWIDLRYMGRWNAQDLGSEWMGMLRGREVVRMLPVSVGMSSCVLLRWGCTGTWTGTCKEEDKDERDAFTRLILRCCQKRREAGCRLGNGCTL